MENPSYRFIKQKLNSLNEQQVEKETYRELAATYIIRYLQAVNNLVLNYPAGSYKTKKAPLFSNYLKSIQTKAEAIGNASENSETPSPLDFIFNESEGVVRTFTVTEDTAEERDIEGKTIYIPSDNKYHKAFCAKMKETLDMYKKGILALGNIETVSINDKVSPNVKYICRLVSADIKVLIQDLKNISPK